MRNRWQMLAFIALTLVAVPAVGDEGRIPIFAAPTVIAAPGKYFVTRNLAIAAGSLITITADDVDIDLNGFVLTSTAAAPVITATGVNGVTIRNGTVIGGSSNLRVNTGTRIVIEGVQVVGATGPSGAGILLEDCTQFAIRRVVAREDQADGIDVLNGLTVPEAEGTIADSLIEGSANAIFVQTSPGVGRSSVSILNNRLESSVFNGIIYLAGEGCLIAGNSISASSLSGMYLATYRCTVRDNVVTANPQAGGSGILEEGDDNLILNNVVANAGGLGFEISGDRNYVEANVANKNGSFGFKFAGVGNIYRRNMARGNAGVPGGLCPAPCSPDLCVSPVGAATATSAGDNFLPGPPTFPACN